MPSTESPPDVAHLLQTIAALNLPVGDVEARELAVAQNSVASLSALIHTPEAHRLLAL